MLDPNVINTTFVYMKKRRSSSNTACQSPASSKPRLFESSILVNKTWGAVKSAGSTIKNTTQQAATIASNQIRAKSASKDPLKIEKRISEELHKIFDDTDSFYYCLDADITNNLQRMNDDDIDDRFFWNKYMIKDIIELEVRFYSHTKLGSLTIPLPYSLYLKIV